MTIYGGKPIGSKIYYKEKCYNSLEWAKNELENAPEGSVFLANIHEYTKGRQNRVWKNCKGQLIVTILLKPKKLNHLDDLSLSLSHLSMALCLGILKPLKGYDIKLKWPNDFMFSNKKIGGMLMQAIWQESKIRGIILGFAINVNNVFDKTDELYERATSLRAVLNKTFDLQALLNKFLKNIDEYYQLWLNLKFKEIFSSYKKEQYYLKKDIRVHKKDGSIAIGTFVNLLPNGNIVIKNKQGEEEISFCTISFFS